MHFFLFLAALSSAQFMHLPVPAELQKLALNSSESWEVLSGQKAYRPKSYFPFDLESYANEAMMSWVKTYAGMNRYNTTAYELDLNKYLDQAGIFVSKALIEPQNFFLIKCFLCLN